LQEKGSHSFSRWTRTQNTTADRKKIKYMDLIVNQYGLEVEVIFLLIIAPIKINIVFVILDILSNLPKDSDMNQKKKKYLAGYYYLKIRHLSLPSPQLTQYQK
jgi:hypothetical protein